MAGMLDNANGDMPMPEEETPMAEEPGQAQAPEQEMDYDSQLQDMEARVPDDMREAWDRIMVAGMKFMFDPQTNRMVNEYLEGPGDMAEKLGNAAAGLMITLDRESRSSLPKELMIPAGIALLILAVKYMKRAGIATVGAADYGKAIEIFMYKILEAYGVKQDQFDGYINQMAAQYEGA